jgi:5'-nucleotidase / UDP-sugar diphosphatase
MISSIPVVPMIFVLWILSSCYCVLVAPSLFAQEVEEDDGIFTLKILHINDHHSHIAEETFSVATVDLDPSITVNINTTLIDQVDVTYGGFPRLVTLFRELEDASTANGTLKVHAGDVFSGTLFFTLFEGTADATVMTPICFDAMTLGNHEFDLGNTALEDFIRQLEQQTNSSSRGQCGDHGPTRILSANLQAPKGSILESQIVPYMIREFGDQNEQVAIVGLTTSTTALTSQPDADTIFMDEVDTLQAIVTQLEDNFGINKIVVLSHLGYNIDITAIAAVKGVDVVIGGHSHTLLGDQDQFTVLGGNAGGPFPTIQNDNVCAVTAWEYAHVRKHQNV